MLFLRPKGAENVFGQINMEVSGLICRYPFDCGYFLETASGHQQGVELHLGPVCEGYVGIVLLCDVRCTLLMIL